MASVENPFSITYGDLKVGGTSSAYQLLGPYVLDRGFESFRLVSDIVVVATSYATLHSLSDTLEEAFSKRDQDLEISLSGSKWAFKNGSNILNTVASLSKAGNAETDRGFSRSYTFVIEAELPATGSSPVSGLRDIRWNVDYAPGRQRAVSVVGSYTATPTSDKIGPVSETSGQLASVNYKHANGADAEASTFLEALDSTASFELVDENYQPDRNDHVCTFSRQYIEILVDQTQAAKDATQIRDHRVTFFEQVSHPGDSEESIYRLHRVKASYECSIDIDQTTDLQSAYTTLIQPHIIALFVTNFLPQIYAVEDHVIGYDETSKRISCTLTILYQSGDGDDTIEIAVATTYRENRAIDYTPLHNGGEFSAIADKGWTIRERITIVTKVIIGEVKPKKRIGEGSTEGALKEGDYGDGGQTISAAGGGGLSSGWNLISSTSQAAEQYIGDPNTGQILITTTNDTTIERFHSGSGSGGFRPIQDPDRSR